MSVMRFYRNVFRLSHACHAFLSECLACGSYLSCVPLGMSCVRFTPAVCRLCAKQDGLRDVPFLFRRGSGSPFVRSRMSRGYRTWLVHFGLARFFMAIPTENERDGGTRRRKGTGERGERKGRGGRRRRRGEAECVFAQAYRLCGVFRGECAGAKGGSRTAAAPQTAPKSHWLSGLSSFGSRCGCVLRSEGDSRTTRACLAPISGGRAKWKRARPAARQRLPVQRRMCFFVTTVSGRKSRDFIYSVRL